MKKVMVFGTFDVLHPGHIHLLKEAKEYGDYLVVIVALDSTVLEVKRKLPKNNEQTRLKKIIDLNLADKVRLGYPGNKYRVIDEEKPDIIALGYDQKFFTDQLEDQLEDHVQIVRLSSYLPEIYKSSKL